MFGHRKVGQPRVENKLRTRALHTKIMCREKTPIASALVFGDTQSIDSLQDAIDGRLNMCSKNTLVRKAVNLLIKLSLWEFLHHLYDARDRMASKSHIVRVISKRRLETLHLQLFND